MFPITRPTFILAVFIYGIYALIMPPYGHNYDMGCWADWAVYIYQHGLSNAYNSTANYLPGHIYELKLYTLLFNSKEEVISNIYYLKYFSLVFDVAGALMVASLVINELTQKLVLMAVLLNPAYLHNTMIWGQFDSVFSCIVFASFLSIYNKKFLLGVILFIISLNFKLQAIIFLPPLTLFMIYRYDKPLHVKNLLIGLGAVILSQLIILLPFLHDNNPLKILTIVRGLGGENGYISLEAANIWQFLMQGNLRWTGDVALFQGITLKKWGLVMYCIALFISLFPFLRNLYRNFILKIKVIISIDKILIMFTLSALCFFYFNTQMHERYSYPAFLFIAAYGVISGSLWIYGLFSLAYFLNADKFMECIRKINYKSSLFDLHIISYFFLATIICLVLKLYLNSQVKKDNPA